LLINPQTASHRDGWLKMGWMALPWRAKLATHRPYTLALCIALCVGFALYLRLIDRFPLREDEAIYSFWALHFWRQDPFFLSVWPDKPPLFLWLLALAFEGWGASPAAGRLLNTMLTLLTALVIGATARRLWGNRSALIACLLYLLNPFAMSFAPTIYTDPMLVLAGQLALWLALTGRSLGAGFWLAVAIMTKQQGLLYVPLISVVLWRAHPVDARRIGPMGSRGLWFLCGLLLVIAPIFYWDSLRWSVAPSPWDLSVRNYGALQLLAPGEWLARGRAWAGLLWYFTASWPLWCLIGALVLSASWSVPLHRLLPLGKSVACWLALWSGGFLLLHITTSVQVWDRYLLPLVPMMCLLVAWASAQASNGFLWSWFPRWQWMGALVGLLLLLPPALLASVGGIPIGADHGASRGLSEAITWLKAQAPANAILYDQQLGWQYQFYLYDQFASGAYERRWFPNAVSLADNAAKVPSRTRWLVQPDWVPQPNLALHLAVRQLELAPAARFGGITIYRVQNKAQAPCDWCLCQPNLPWRIMDRQALYLERGQP